MGQARMGPVREHNGDVTKGCARAKPVREMAGLALARTNPRVPMVARTNPAWDQSGLAIWDRHTDKRCQNYYTQHVRDMGCKI